MQPSLVPFLACASMALSVMFACLAYRDGEKA
jgi:hypothetical protein